MIKKKIKISVINQEQCQMHPVEMEFMENAHNRGDFRLSKGRYVSQTSLH